VNKIAIKGDSDYDVTLDTQDLTDLFADVEETKAWSEIAEACENGDVSLEILREKEHTPDDKYKKYYWRWHVCVYAGEHCLEDWRTNNIETFIKYVKWAEENIEILKKYPPKFFITKKED